MDEISGDESGSIFAGGGAKIENVSPGNLRRVQNAANRTRQIITIVGSRAAGNAGPYSDWDYVATGASSRTRRSLASSLPEGPRGIGSPRNQDIFTGMLDPNRPHISVIPKGY